MDFKPFEVVFHCCLFWCNSCNFSTWFCSRPSGCQSFT